VSPSKTIVSSVFLEKSNPPILVTLAGIVMLEMPVPTKISDPIFLTLLGMIKLVRLLQPSKAQDSMEVTLLGTV